MQQNPNIFNVSTGRLESFEMKLSNGITIVLFKEIASVVTSIINNNNTTVTTYKYSIQAYSEAIHPFNGQKVYNYYIFDNIPENRIKYFSDIEEAIEMIYKFSIGELTILPPVTL